MSDAYWTDNAHVLLTGVTGARGDYLDDAGGSFGGKSALATYWLDNHGRERDLIIFANFKNDDVGDVLTDFTEVATVDDLANAMSTGARKLILTPSDPDWAAVSDRLEGFVRALPDDMSKIVVLDEAPELDEDAVLSFVRVHGNGANCKTILLAQSPTDLTTSIVKQVLLTWVGPMKSDYRSWFRTHEYGPAYEFIAETHQPYHFTIVFGKNEGEWEHYQPVPERYVV